MTTIQIQEDEIITKLRAGNINLCVVGLGRIGFPTATLFADAGANVTGVDINHAIVKSINSGESHLADEPSLEDIIKEVTNSGKLKATTDIHSAAAQADVIIICVPTPVDQTKTPDYTCIIQVCGDVGRALSAGKLIVIESTVGPGLVEDLIQTILEAESGLKAGVDFSLASCPERADPSNIVKDMKTVPRIVGGVDKASTEAAAALYHHSFKVNVIKVSSPKVANAIKLTENLFRDVNIALANEFALLYEKLGVDVIEVINGCATKYNFIPHYPGPGVGGPCLPANPYYLIVEGVKVGNIPYLVRMAREINDRMPDHVVNLICEALNETGKTVRKSRIAILGVSYKQDVKDTQLTPMERVLKQLEKMGAILSIYDPYYKGEEVFGIKTAKRMEEAIHHADCIVIGVPHREFASIDLKSFRTQVHNPAAFVDTRNVVSPETVLKQGFIYRGIGRPRH